MSGRVLSSWEDYDVSNDTPYGVERVIRMWIWNYVPERKPQENDGEISERLTTQYSAYELAVVVRDDRPLPELGDYVSATGRFLKVQRYRIRENYTLSRGSIRDPNRPLSDSSYFKFIVANDYDVGKTSRSSLYTWP